MVRAPDIKVAFVKLAGTIEMSDLQEMQAHSEHITETRGR
jgi:hypothetical protein